MEKDRRSAPRIKVNLPARWEGVLNRSEATITDLSLTGCFVLTGGVVEVRELISLELQLPTQRWLHVWCEVVDEASEIGFAVKFNSISDEDEQRLMKYIEDQFNTQPIKRSE
jgi:c-di-GMP-binding flagellar brake protein YcgR